MGDTDEVPECGYEEGFRHKDTGEYEIWTKCTNAGNHEVEEGEWLCWIHYEDHRRSEEADLAVKRTKEW